MSHRLTRITTRTGDDGSTGLGDGTRVRKDAPRVAVMGDLDELNSQLGLLRTEPLPASVATALERIQNDLFDLGGELCIPTHRMLKADQVLQLDAWIGQFNADLPALKEFIIPGGSRAAALCHVARATCRRAERSAVALAAGSGEDVAPAALQYLNRLSDLLFILARTLNQHANHPDTQWQRHP